MTSRRRRVQYEFYIRPTICYHSRLSSAVATVTNITPIRRPRHLYNNIMRKTYKNNVHQWCAVNSEQVFGQNLKKNIRKTNEIFTIRPVLTRRLLSISINTTVQDVWIISQNRFRLFQQSFLCTWEYVFEKKSINTVLFYGCAPPEIVQNSQCSTIRKSLRTTDVYVYRSVLSIVIINKSV